MSSPVRMQSCAPAAATRTQHTASFRPIGHTASPHAAAPDISRPRALPSRTPLPRRRSARTRLANFFRIGRTKTNNNNNNALNEQQHSRRRRKSAAVNGTHAHTLRKMPTEGYFVSATHDEWYERARISAAYGHTYRNEKGVTHRASTDCSHCTFGTFGTSTRDRPRFRDNIMYTASASSSSSPVASSPVGAFTSTRATNTQDTHGVQRGKTCTPPRQWSWEGAVHSSQLIRTLSGGFGVRRWKSSKNVQDESDGEDYMPVKRTTSTSTSTYCHSPIVHDTDDVMSSVTRGSESEDR